MHAVFGCLLTFLLSITRRHARFSSFTRIAWPGAVPRGPSIYARVPCDVRVLGCASMDNLAAVERAIAGLAARAEALENARDAAAAEPLYLRAAEEIMAYANMLKSAQKLDLRTKRAIEAQALAWLDRVDFLRASEQRSAVPVTPAVSSMQGLSASTEQTAQYIYAHIGPDGPCVYSAADRALIDEALRLRCARVRLNDVEVQ